MTPDQSDQAALRMAARICRAQIRAAVMYADNQDAAFHDAIINEGSDEDSVTAMLWPPNSGPADG